MKHLEYCILYSIHYTLYSIRCTIHYTVYIIQCTIHYTVYNVHCTYVQYTLYSIQYTICMVYTILYSVYCTLYSAWIVRNACSILYNVHRINIQYTLYNTPTKLKTKYHANILFLAHFAANYSKSTFVFGYLIATHFVIISFAWLYIKFILHKFIP